MPVVFNPWENINEAHRNLISGIQSANFLKRSKQADVRAEKELLLRENQQNVWEQGAKQQQELTGMEIAGRKAEQSALVSATGATDYAGALTETMKTRSEQEARKADLDGFKTVMDGFKQLMEARAPAPAIKQYFGAAARMNPRMSEVYQSFDVAPQTGETSVPVHSDGKTPLKQALGLSDEAWQRFGLSPDHILPEGYYQVVSGPQKAAITPIKAEQAQPGAQPLSPLSGQPIGPPIPERKVQPTEAGLAERAAGGDQTAEAALKRLERSKLASRPTINLMTGNDAKDIADAIEAGNQPPDTKGLYRNAAPVRAELARRKYNLTHANLDWQAVQRQIATLNGPQQTRLRQSIETASELTDSIEQTYNNLQKVAPSYGYKLLNHYNLRLMKNLPGDAGALAQKLETQIADLTADIANVYMGGNSPTDHGLDLGAKNLSGEWNPETFKRAIETLRTNITIRRNSILLTQPIGPGGQSAMPGGETVRPSAAPRGGAGGKVSVNVPGKGPVWFPNQAAADAFKRETGIP